MIVVWTETALEHLAGIKQYIGQTSPLYAELVVRRIFGRGKQLEAFPESGRMVPKLGRPEIREVIEAPISGRRPEKLTPKRRSSKVTPRPGCT